VLKAHCLCCDFTTAADEAPPSGCPRCHEVGRAVNLVLDVPRAPGLPLTLDEARDRILGPDSGTGHGTAAPGASSGIGPADGGVWRFAPRLPGVAPPHRVDLGEGDTPLLQLDDASAGPGDPALWVKDEGLNPTGSFKDRFMAVAVSRARAVGARVLVAASSGNGGTSAAAYAARAGLACVVIATPALPEPPRRYLQALGTPVVAVPDVEARWLLMRRAVEAWGWYPLTNHTDPPSGGDLFGIDGYKTIAFEIVAHLGRAPDHVFVPLALGDGLLGIWRGFVETHALGRADRTPRMVAVEPAAAAPVTAARAAERDHPEAVDRGASVAYNVGSSCGTAQAMAVLERSAGDAAAAPEKEIVATRRALAEDHGIHAEASAALAVWGALRHRREGGTGTVVAVVTASGLKDPRPGVSSDERRQGPMAAPGERLPVVDPDLDSLRRALPTDFPPPSPGPP